LSWDKETAVFRLYFASGVRGSARRFRAQVQRNNQESMEFLNKIELKGVVGRAEINSFNNSQVCNFSVVTEYSTIDKERNSIIETAWFNVSAWSGRNNITDLYNIQRGSWVHVIGRLRVRKYTTQTGEERSAMDVIAGKVVLLPKDEEASTMQPQRD
jgi:single-stranded DNA-binding protein